VHPIFLLDAVAKITIPVLIKFFLSLVYLTLSQCLLSTLITAFPRILKDALQPYGLSSTITSKTKPREFLAQRCIYEQVGEILFYALRNVYF
jgi:hypothetical protein